MQLPGSTPTPFVVRLSLGRKVGLLFASLALLFVALGGLVSREVAATHESLRLVLEEHREDTLARDLVRCLKSIEASSLLAGDTVVTTTPQHALTVELLDGADASIAEMIAGPHSSELAHHEHQAQEDRFFAELQSDLAIVRVALVSEGAPAAARAALQRALTQAHSLQVETRREARAAALSMDEHTNRAKYVVIAAALLALVGLAAIFWVADRSFIHPIRKLADGARRIATGDLQQSLAVRTSDEIGLLTSEFNAMAKNLADVHADQERRVAERTRDFLRAARLADMGTLAAGIAHEINNPLASIASCAEGLERRVRAGSSRTEDQVESLQIIAKEAYRAHDITSRLLDFAHQDTATKSLMRLGDIVNETRIFLEHRLAKRGVTLVTDCDRPTARIVGSPSEWKQVLLNLIQNAFDFSPDGGRIFVRCRSEADRVVLEVEDEGQGIPPDHFERIFDPFFTTKAPGKGTGLGLAIVARIIEAHEGHIRASNGARGAIFRIDVPAAVEAVR